jgi:hypothetical protein
MQVKLRMTGKQHDLLKEHLLAADGKEAAALALCGRRAGEDTQCLLVRKIEPIPYSECAVRERDLITWPTQRLVPLLEEAAKRHLGILKIHSHPQGLWAFSARDDAADRELFTSVHGWCDDDLPHVSAVMLPGGEIFGRTVGPLGQFSPLSSVSVAGDEIHFWHAAGEEEAPEFVLRNEQAFGRGTVNRLRQLTIAVVGCSGTGSPLVEQLARLRVGRLVLVDPQSVEEKNLNRIVNATMEDAKVERLKVEVAARAIAAMGMGTEVETISENLCTPRVIKRVADCDILFGCVDGAEGRHVLNRLAAFYLVPYFDVGVRLDADGKGGIDQIAGTVHYLKPDGSSLVSRKVITLEEARAENLRRTNPGEYKERVREGYLRGVQEDRPAVIPVNMHYASLAVLELLARLHQYRNEENARFAAYGSSLVNADLYYQGDEEPDRALAREAGRGDVVPLLDMPSLSERGGRP